MADDTLMFLLETPASESLGKLRKNRPPFLLNGMFFSLWPTILSVLVSGYEDMRNHGLGK